MTANFSEQLLAFSQWVWPYLASIGISLAGFAGVLKTGWGLSLFNAGIKHQFDKKLNELKHEKDRDLSQIKHDYDKDIESVKSKLFRYTDRGIRSNEREYQAFIAIWEKFIEAYHATHGAVGGLRSVPELRNMSEEELDEWMELEALSTVSRRFIKNSSNKDDAYYRIIRSQDLSKANQAIWDAHDTLRRQSVFIPSHIEDQTDTALATMRLVWSENWTNFSMPGSLPMNASMAFSERGNDMKNAVRDVIRTRVLQADLIAEHKV